MKIFALLASIAQQVQPIKLLAAALTSIKICKVSQHASLLAPKDISALIVQGHNVSLRTLMYLSIVMVLRKLQSIAVLELTIR